MQNFILPQITENVVFGSADLDDLRQASKSIRPVQLSKRDDQIVPANVCRSMSIFNLVHHDQLNPAITLLRTELNSQPHLLQALPREFIAILQSGPEQ